MADAIEVEFYYGLGSRYSYLAATQISRLESETGCRVAWRPLYSADLMTRRGMNPFAGQALSGQYDWAYRRADAEAWADYYGVPYREPADVRFEPREAALACIAAARLGAAAPYSLRVFQAIFAEGRSPLDVAAYGDLATACGLDGSRLTGLIGDGGTARIHGATIDQAIARGAFGVPTFHVAAAGRTIWGNDRLPLLRHCLGRLRAG